MSGPVIETDSMGFPVVVEDLDADLLLEFAEESENSAGPRSDASCGTSPSGAR